MPSTRQTAITSVVLFAFALSASARSTVPPAASTVPTAPTSAALQRALQPVRPVPQSGELRSPAPTAPQQQAAQHARDWVDYWTLAFTIVGVIILACYTAAAIWQAILTRRAIREARESTEKSTRIATDSLVLGRRAWLVVHMSDNGFPPIPHGISPRISISSHVHVQNTGGVPAIVQRFGCGFLIDVLPDRLCLSADRSQSCATVVCGDEREPLDLSWHVLECFPHGQQTVYFYWIVEYSDCFDKTWRTTRCWRRVETLQTWESVPGYNLLE
jgi:hypothetical protein